MDAPIDTKALREAALPEAFVTAQSGGGEYAVHIKCQTMSDMHRWHDAVLDAYRAPLAPDRLHTEADVRVKALEWREIGDDYWQADTSIGWYSVTPDKADGFTHTLSLNARPLRSFKSAVEAKVAGNADHETRIRAALQGGDNE